MPEKFTANSKSEINPKPAETSSGVKNTKNLKSTASKVHFEWNSYFGFATYARSNSGTWRLFINWKLIFGLLVALFILAYLGVTTLRYANDKYRKGIENTEYLDMLLYPFSLDARMNHRRKLGEYYMQRAREANVPGEVIGNVRAALSHYPMNAEGRIYYSYILFYQRLVKEGIKFLADGLPASLDHNEYVTYFVRRCLETTEDEILIEAAEKNIEDPKITPDNRMILAVGAAQACVLRGRFEEAREIMKKYHIDGTMTGKVLIAQIYWESGEQEKAVDILDLVVRESNNIQVILLRALYLANMGEFAKARSGLIRSAIENNTPDVRIRIISLLNDTRDKEFLNRMIESYLQDYKNDSQALLALAQYATDRNNFELTKRIYTIANEKILPDLHRFEMHYIEALTAAGKAEEAIKFLDRFSEENMAWVEQNSATLDCLRTMAYYRAEQENLGKLSLERVLKNKTISVTQLILVGRRLTEMGRLDEGRAAYEAAYFIENYNHKALVALIDYALKKRDIRFMFRYLPEFLDSRRPPRPVLINVQRFLASDRLMFIPETEAYLKRVTEILESKTGTKNNVSVDVSEL